MPMRPPSRGLPPSELGRPVLPGCQGELECNGALGRGDSSTLRGRGPSKLGVEGSLYATLPLFKWTSLL